MVYKLVLGDWSKDGHKQSEDFLFDCNYDVHKIRQAYKDSCKKLGVAFHDEDYENCTKPLSDDYSNVWTDYETPYIDETDFEILNNAESFNMEEESNKEMLLEFRETAEKLKKVTAILKAQEWFGKVGKLSGPYIPHSFILDTRYNTIYQMHMELKQNEVQIHLNPEFDYTWKRSSYLYEMWCFFKVCHFCFEKLDLEYSDWNFDLKGEVFFPFLKEGTMVRFSNPVIRVDVVYDQCLPLEKEATDINHPLYIAKQHGNHRNHNRPDIVLNVYDNERNVYLGSIILECKYRKLHSFWSEDSTRSSRGQLEAYYNNARSSHLLAGLGESFNIRPISKVLALSPDDRADGLEQEDFGIEIKTFKPTEDGREEHINQWIFEEIVNLEKRYDKFWRIIWPDEQAEVHFV